MTAQERITEWAALANAATDGPWEDWRGNGGGVYITTAANGIRGLYTCAATNPSPEQWRRLEDDAAHIAASRTAVPVMAAALTAVLALHRAITIYDECDCTDEQKETGHEDVYEVGITCNRLYVICDECCRDDVYQTEDCASNHPHPCHPCPTVAAIETALEARL